MNRRRTRTSRNPTDRPGAIARACLLALLGAWLVASAAKGGLRQAAAGVLEGIRNRGQAPPGQPDARVQWLGPFYDALSVLTRDGITPQTTVAVVLTEADFGRLNGPATPKQYEAFYRLYPTKADFYFRQAHGSFEPFWFPTIGRAPRTPGLWEHDYVLLADIAQPQPPPQYGLTYSNIECRLYRRAGG